jgi:tRNA A37 threonylcarbamoyladenosine synthetase subunit TsaC/SUA5/YrdC
MPVHVVSSRLQTWSDDARTLQERATKKVLCAVAVQGRTFDVDGPGPRDSTLADLDENSPEIRRVGVMGTERVQ